jgi:DUF1680 family protein
MIFSALAEETLGQVAVGRGRIAYCRESVDLLRVVKPLDVARVPDIKLCARYDQRLPDGVAVLEGTTFTRTDGNWADQLYRELPPPKPAPNRLRLDHCSVLATRGPAEMSV